MTNHAHVTGTVTETKRHGTTYVGNPIMSAYIIGEGFEGWYRISDNAGLVYGIDNLRLDGGTHTFALTRAGRISHHIRN